jgi:hypothetical protein
MSKSQNPDNLFITPIDDLYSNACGDNENCIDENFTDIISGINGLCEDATSVGGDDSTNDDCASTQSNSPVTDRFNSKKVCTGVVLSFEVKKVSLTDLLKNTWKETVESVKKGCLTKLLLSSPNTPVTDRSPVLSGKI